MRKRTTRPTTAIIDVPKNQTFRQRVDSLELSRKLFEGEVKAIRQTLDLSRECHEATADYMDTDSKLNIVFAACIGFLIGDWIARQCTK